MEGNAVKKKRNRRRTHGPVMLHSVPVGHIIGDKMAAGHHKGGSGFYMQP